MKGVSSKKAEGGGERIKNWGAIVAAIILAAAIVFLGLCGRYTITSYGIAGVPLKLDRLTGQVKVVTPSH